MRYTQIRCHTSEPRIGGEKGEMKKMRQTVFNCLPSKVANVKHYNEIISKCFMCATVVYSPL